MLRYAYNITEDDIFYNIDRIHPLMQKPVSELVRYCSKVPGVRCVVIFGSSVTDHCNSYSDLDAYVGGVKIRALRDFEPSIPIAMDLFADDNISPTSALAKEIERTGVIVYGTDLDGRC